MVRTGFVLSGEVTKWERAGKGPAKKKNKLFLQRKKKKSQSCETLKKKEKKGIFNLSKQQKKFCQNNFLVLRKNQGATVLEGVGLKA